MRQNFPILANSTTLSQIREFWTLQQIKNRNNLTKKATLLT